MKTNATERPFGRTSDGREVRAFVLTQRDGMQAEFIEFGASLTSLKVLVGDRLRELCLGCDSLADYEAQAASLGAVVGRCANRTAYGRLHVDGATHQLDINLGEHHLHGGAEGFGKQVWSGQLRVDHRGPSVRFVYLSPAGQSGYPGNLEITVDYTLDENGRLWMEYRALCDAPTAVNVTNHAYFNLGDDECVDCKDHVVMVRADRYVATDDDRVPSGQLPSVDGTPLDLRSPRRIRGDLESDHPLIHQGSGYDHTLVFSDEGDGVREVAHVESPDGLLRMTLATDQPSLQLYTGNFLEGTPGPAGHIYGVNAGICLEAQGLPDASKHPGFPSIIIRPGELYQQRTIYRFEV